MTVKFEVVRETGPPHMRTFLTKCIVGNHVAEGEGNGKTIRPDHCHSLTFGSCCSRQKGFEEERRRADARPAERAAAPGLLSARAKQEEGGGRQGQKGQEKVQESHQGRAEGQPRIRAVDQPHLAADSDPAGEETERTSVHPDRRKGNAKASRIRDAGRTT